MKAECTPHILIPLDWEQYGVKSGLTSCGINEQRPSQALGGRTPREVYADLRPANAGPRFEPRGNWPLTGPCALPQTAIKGKRGTKLSLVVGYMEGRRLFRTTSVAITAANPRTCS
jgi:hypothetical protein